MKARIDNLQKNSECELYNKRNKTINHRVNEGSKLVQRK